MFLLLYLQPDFPHSNPCPPLSTPTYHSALPGAILLRRADSTSVSFVAGCWAVASVSSGATRFSFLLRTRKFIDLLGRSCCLPQRYGNCPSTNFSAPSTPPRSLAALHRLTHPHPRLATHLYAVVALYHLLDLLQQQISPLHSHASTATVAGVGLIVSPSSLGRSSCTNAIISPPHLNINCAARQNSPRQK
jgi:hypothetical protein